MRPDHDKLRCWNMRRCATLLGLFIAACVVPQSAWAIESPGQLASYCQKLEKGARGTGENIQIPNTREALLCWGYMQAIQDLSMLADTDGHRLIGSCPPTDTRLRDFVRAFLEYEQLHRSDVEANTVVVVTKALQQAYPCAGARVGGKP
ncbi:MAG: hypothetical protein V7604_3201 [Hyphomicrobiales bacterium]|jgi:hypothetical protein